MLIELYPISKFYDIIKDSGKIPSLSINILIHSIFDDSESLVLINSGELIDKMNKFQRDIDTIAENDCTDCRISWKQIYIRYCEMIMSMIANNDMPDQFIVSRGVIINGAY